ncbi:HEAT repeat domain-containing protein [Lentzea alba]|uniref:nSTAND1 domain-containing NTPase n=1 Tax=Lentzea alba TaxID=2714351 RepID=UPI0039BFA621
MRQLRVFLSSPGDVTGERTVARTVIDQLQYDPFVRGRIFLDVVAWDQPGGAPLSATETPQASINRGMPRPSECDVVIVILWSRMGTPLPFPAYATSDGQPYLSGTDWEFQDAVRGGPVVLVYRCSAPVLLDPDAPDFDARLAQKRAVDTFFARMSDPETGALLRGYKQYAAPEDFRATLEQDLRAVVHQHVAGVPRRSDGLPPAWTGSPFPGLRAFTTRDAPIYFGRGREADQLVARVTASSFVAVVGASGSGKSSLVGAGLLPRLERSGWTLPRYDGPRWSGLRFTPGEAGDNPFDATARRLGPSADALSLARDPNQVVDLLPPGVSLIFVDQFEELFTLVDPAYVDPWIALLEAAAGSGRCHVVVTLRADFYHRCLEIPRLARLLETGQLPLSAPTEGLFDMITRPAERADLTFEEGLPGRILHDTGSDPDALPLLAYTLDELYRARAGGVLDHATYERLGGVQGAIGTRAEHVFVNLLDSAARSAFGQVFRDLVRVDEDGLAARRRALLSQVASSDAAGRFVEVLTQARLLVQNRDEHNRPVVYVAHEALFGSWERLADWIQATRDDLLLEHKVTAAAAEWDRNGRDDVFRWPHERMEPVYAMLERRGTTLDPLTTAFVEPEHLRLLPRLLSPQPRLRDSAVDRLVLIGPPAIPGLLELLNRPTPPGIDDDLLLILEAAATALGRIGAAAMPGLFDTLRHSDPEVRLAALAGLRVMDDSGIALGVGSVLRDPDVRVRSAAVGMLKRVGTVMAMAMLGSVVEDGPEDLRWEAVGALGAYGPSAVSTLLELDGEPARRALLAIGDRGLPELLKGLRDDSAQVRHNAAMTLVALGEAALPGVITALGDDSPDVRWLACEILSAIGDDSATPHLLGLMHDADPAIRSAAAHALGSEVRLTEALTDGDHDVRWAAADALAESDEDVAAEYLLDVASLAGPARALALGVWIRCAPADLRGVGPIEDEWVWHRVADAAAVRGQTALPELVAWLANPLMPEHERLATARALAAIGSAAVPVLLGWARFGEAFVTADAIRAVGWIARHDPARANPLGDPGALRALPDLGELLNDHAYRRDAADALADFGEDALPVVWQAMTSPDPAVREAATGMAVKIGGKAVPGLLKLLDHDVAAMPAEVALRTIATPAALFGLADR